MDTPKLNTKALKVEGNVVEFPFWATKEFEEVNGLDKSEFEYHTPDTLQIAFKLAYDRHQAAEEVLQHVTDDDIMESKVAIQAYYEMLNDSEERLHSIETYVISKGWEYEVLPDGILHFPSLDKSK